MTALADAVLAFLRSWGPVVAMGVVIVSLWAWVPVASVTVSGPPCP